MAREISDQKEYVTILSSDGSFRLSVPEGTDGAVKRDYETSDGTKGTKNELVLTALSGKITGVEFKDMKFGRVMNVDITDENGTLTISMGTQTNFATDLMKKLPNMDLSKEYRLMPFAFTNDKGKSVKGISITEGTDKPSKDTPKIKNFFYDEEEKKNLHGFPEITKDISKMTKNNWKAYFGEVEDFLVEYNSNNGAAGTKEEETGEIDLDKEAEEIMG